MYSDDEQSLDCYHHPPSVELRYYEREEAELLNFLVGEKRVGQPHDRHRRLYPVLRFFATISGIHEGIADLTGRHPARVSTIEARWNQYILEFNDIRQTAKAIPSSWTDHKGKERPCITHEMTDPVAWEQFLSRWRADGWEFDDLLIHTEETVETIKLNPTPKVQQLCLMDLPNELLYRVFDFTPEEDARLFSATCKRLHEIGLDYIFRSRILSLSTSPFLDWSSIKEEMDGIHRFTILQDAVNRAREAICDASRFLLSRPDLTVRVQSASLDNNWTPSSLRDTRAYDFDATASDPEIFSPVFSLMVQVLGTFTNLTNLRITHIDLGDDFITAISGLTALHTLILWDSFPSYTDEATSLRPAPIGQSLNLSLLITRAERSPHLWHFLSLCSNIVTLSIRSVVDDILGPPESVWQRCNPFRSVKYLSIQGVDSWDVPEIIVPWLQSAQAEEQLQISRFRIKTKYGLDAPAVTELLQAMHGTPMAALVLEGLAEAGTSLLDEISGLFPDLTALSLVLRQNERQVKTKPVRWPQPCWEYAPHLSALTRLRFFGWNFEIPWEEFSPWLMIGLERVAGYEPGIEVVKLADAKKMEDPSNEEVWLQERTQIPFSADYVVKPLASHCPSLEMVTFIGDGVPLGFGISRTQDRISVKEKKFMDAGKLAKGYCLWDSHYSWPSIIPSHL